MGCCLRIKQSGGNVIYSTEDLRVTTNSSNKITAITYGTTTVASVTAYNGANDLYEVGELTDGGIFRTMLSN